MDWQESLALAGHLGLFYCLFRHLLLIPSGNHICYNLAFSSKAFLSCKPKIKSNRSFHIWLKHQFFRDSCFDPVLTSGLLSTPHEFFCYHNNLYPCLGCFWNMKNMRDNLYVFFLLCNSRVRHWDDIQWLVINISWMSKSFTRDWISTLVWWLRAIKGLLSTIAFHTEMLSGVRIQEKWGIPFP